MRRERRQQRQPLLPILRDVGSTLVALGGIVYQQATGQVNAVLLGVYITLLGVPMAAGLRSVRNRGETGTTGSGSSSPEPSPQPVLPIGSSSAAASSEGVE